jgi:hypothetical protein
VDAPIIRVTAQRHSQDCAVACLSMVCGVPYENALVALAQDCPDICVTGCWTEHITKAAQRLGFMLKKRRRFDLEADTGILNTSSQQFKNDHLVVLWEGRIIDTDGVLYMHDVYFSINKAKATALFVAERKP